MRQNFLYRLDRLFRGKVESEVVAARLCRPRPGRPALPQGCWPNRDPPIFLIFYYNLLINDIKSSKILPLLWPRPLWLEEDGETKRLGTARALVIEAEVF